MTLFQKFQNLLGFKEKTLHESSLGRIYQHSQNRTIGIITAFRSEEPYKTNVAANSQLQNSIRQNGFGFVRVEGHWIENKGLPGERKVKEESFLVISDAQDNGKLKGFLRAAGQRFNQEGVVYKEPNGKAVVIGTRAGGWPGLGVEHVIGNFKANGISDTYSKMRNKKGSFVFESVTVPDGFLAAAYKPRT